MEFDRGITCIIWWFFGREKEFRDAWFRNSWDSSSPWRWSSCEHDMPWTFYQLPFIIFLNARTWSIINKIRFRVEIFCKGKMNFLMPRKWSQNKRLERDIFLLTNFSDWKNFFIVLRSFLFCKFWNLLK